MPDHREEYSDQFVDSKWGHYLIRRIDPSKNRDPNLALLLDSKIKKEPLKGVVDFLKNNFAVKYPRAVEILVNSKKPNINKNDLANQIIDFVLQTIPHLCLTCKNSYFPYMEENRSDGDEVGVVNCFHCTVPAHAKCIKENSVSLQQGIVYICETCITNKDKADVVITDETGKPAETTKSPADPTDTENIEESDDDDEDKESKKKEKKKKLKVKKKALQKSNYENHETSESDSDEPSSNLCPEYKWGRCKSFDTCPYDHPPRCWSWLQHGKCPYKVKCRYSHPPLCRYSRRERTCFNIHCKFFHLYGTKRSQVNENGNQSNQNQASGRALQSSHSNNFNHPRMFERPSNSNTMHQPETTSARNPIVRPQTTSNPTDLSFLMNMIKEMQKSQEDFRKEITSMVQEKRNQQVPNPVAADPPQANTTNHQAVPMQTQTAYGNYLPSAPVYQSAPVYPQTSWW